MLLYSAIDTLAWLGLPEPRTTRTVFKDWAQRYLLANQSLQCTAEELYAARCGILHTGTAESDLTAQPGVRQIWYYTGTTPPPLLSSTLAITPNLVAVRVLDLIVAFIAGAEAFEADIATDDTRIGVAEAKAKKWLAWFPASLAV